MIKMTNALRDKLSNTELRHTRQRGLRNMVGWFVSEYPLQAVFSAILFLVSGVLDSIGIMLMLPVLGLILNVEVGEQNWLTVQILSIFENIGIPSSVEWVLIVLVSVILTKFLVRLTAGVLIGNFAAKITREVRIGLINAMIKANWVLFSREKTGDYVQALVNDSGKTAKASLAISEGLARVLQVMFLMATSFLISWQFTLAAVVLGAGTTFVLSFFVRILRRIAEAQVISMRMLNQRLIDGIVVMKAMKAMGRLGKFQKAIHQDINDLKYLQSKSIISNEFMRLIPEPLGAISIALGMIVLLPIWDGGTEGLLTVLYLFYRLHEGLSSLPISLKNITTGQPAFYFVLNLWAATKEYEEREGGTLEVPVWKELTFENVTFQYDNSPILKNAKLSIKRGEFVTFFGPSGRGKTTAVDLIIGLLETVSGRVLIDKLDLFDFDKKAWREQIGYVPQDCLLFTGTIFENMTLGDEEISADRVRDALRSSNILEFVEGLSNGIFTEISERGMNFSGGQRQRLSLARALVHKPKLLILDEVTAALDVKTEGVICAELQRLHHDTNGDLTIVAISHRPALAKISDRSFSIHEGKIVEANFFGEEE